MTDACKKHNLRVVIVVKWDCVTHRVRVHWVEANAETKFNLPSLNVNYLKPEMSLSSGSWWPTRAVIANFRWPISQKKKYKWYHWFNILQYFICLLKWARKSRWPVWTFESKGLTLCLTRLLLCVCASVSNIHSLWRCDHWRFVTHCHWNAMHGVNTA